MTNPAKVLADAIFLGVVFLKTISCLPMRIRLERPSVRYTIFAGTCSLRPRRLAEWAPEARVLIRSFLLIALTTPWISGVAVRVLDVFLGNHKDPMKVV